MEERKIDHKINYSIVNYVRRNVTPSLNSVFDEIYFLYGKNKNGVKMSANKIAERLPIGIATVKRSLADLEELGYITNFSKGKRTKKGCEYEVSTWKINEDYIISLFSEYQNDTRFRYQNDTDNNNYDKNVITNNYLYQNDTGCSKKYYTSNEVKQEEGFEEKNNWSSKGNNSPAEPEEKNNINCLPSNEGWKSRKAAQDKLNTDFNSFLHSLNVYTLQEQKEKLESFKLRAETAYTGEYVEKTKTTFQKRYDGYSRKCGKPYKMETAQPAPTIKNNGMSREEVESLINEQIEVMTESKKLDTIRNLNTIVCQSNTTIEEKGKLFNHLQNILEEWNTNSIVKETASVEVVNDKTSPATEESTPIQEEVIVEVKEEPVENKTFKLSNDCIYYRLKSELNQITEPSAAKDWAWNNKNAIQQLEPQQKEELKKLYIQIYHAAK